MPVIITQTARRVQTSLKQAPAPLIRRTIVYPVGIYRFIRLRVTDSPVGGGGVSFVEAELALTVAGADITAGKTYSSSPTFAGNEADKAFDDNTATAFNSNFTGYPVDLIVDFGSNQSGWVNPAELRITARGGGDENQAPRGFTVDASPDGMFWFNGATQSGVTFTASQTKSFALSFPTASTSTTSYSLTADAGTFALTGNAAGLAYGYKLPAVTATFSLVGNATGLAYGRKLTAAVGTFALTGNTTGLRAARKLAVTTATFALTGNATGLTYGRKLTAATATFSLTGNAVGLKDARKFAVATGSFALTGNATGLRTGYRLTAATGSFALTGQAVGLQRALRLTVSSGTYALTGNATALTNARRLSVSAGAFILTGNNAGLTLTGNQVMPAATGSFVLTGNSVGLRRATRLSISPASFAVTGYSVSLRIARSLSAQPGAFVLTGYPVDLSYFHPFFFKAVDPPLASLLADAEPGEVAIAPTSTPVLAAIATLSAPAVPLAFVKATRPPRVEIQGE